MDSMNDMLLVIEIADTGNFTQAGARLGMPKSTISHRVTQLENGSDCDCSLGQPDPLA